MDKTQLWHAFRGIVAAAVGAATAYIVAEAGSLDLGVYGPIVVSVSAVITHTIHVWADGPADPKTEKTDVPTERQD